MAPKGRPSGATAPTVPPLTVAFSGVFEGKTFEDYTTSPKLKAMDVELLLSEQAFLQTVQQECPTFNIGRPKIFHALMSEAAKDTTSVPLCVRLVVRSRRLSVLCFDK